VQADRQALESTSRTLLRIHMRSQNPNPSQSQIELTALRAETRAPTEQKSARSPVRSRGDGFAQVARLKGCAWLHPLHINNVRRGASCMTHESLVSCWMRMEPRSLYGISYIVSSVSESYCAQRRPCIHTLYKTDI
jgi:hypothetical protein